MAFWSTEKLKERLNSGQIISPYLEENVLHSAYELLLGNEVFATSDVANQSKTTVPDGNQVSIEPGQIALLVSKETISMPLDAIGLISIKAGKKLRGLLNISGFHVDPGFKGILKFSVYNAGPKPIILDVNKPLFLLWLVDLDRTTESLYTGEHINQSNITSKDVERLQGVIHSPMALDERVSKLETLMKVLIALAIAVLAGLILMIPSCINDNQSVLNSKRALPVEALGKPTNFNETPATIKKKNPSTPTKSLGEMADPKKKWQGIKKKP